MLHKTPAKVSQNTAANGGAAIDLRTCFFAMQLYCVIGSFPDIDSQLAGYREFINYFDGGCVNDSFEGFELLHRVHLPGQGQVVALLKANGTAELFKHLAPWRAQFGVEMDITPAISDAEVVANHKVLFAEMDA